MDKILPWPEVPSVLVKLRKNGVRLGVVTNCSNELGLRAIGNLEKIVQEEMGDSGEGFSFDAVVTAEESESPNSQRRFSHSSLEARK